MNRRRRWLGTVAALATLLGGCSRAHTAIVLRVDSDLGSALQSVEVTVTRAGDAAPSFDRTFAVGGGGFAIPGTVAITPRDPADARDVQLHVVGTLATHATVTRDVATHFTAGETTSIEVTLSLLCDAGEGCPRPDAGAADCGADAGSVDFTASFEGSGYAPFDQLSPVASSCFAVVASPVRDGVGAAQFTVAPGDAVGSREQCLLMHDVPAETEGNDAYFAWSVFLPATWTAPPAPVRIAGWSGVLAPTIALAIGTDDMFQIELHAGYVDTTAMTFERDETNALNVPALAGHWHDFVVHVVFQSAPTGRIEVTYRSSPDAAFTTLPAITDDTLQRDDMQTLPSTFFVGLDRAPAAITRSLVFDRIRRGTRFDAVSQDGCAL